MAGFIDNTYVGSLKGRYNCFWNEETARLDRFENCEFIDEQLLKNIKGKKIIIFLILFIKSTKQTDYLRIKYH